MYKKIIVLLLMLTFILAADGWFGGNTAPVVYPSTSSQTSAQSPASETEQSESPPITIYLDYFGIKDTHWMSQIGGDELAEIQLFAIISDEQGTLAVWPPQNVSNLTFDMDYFQVESLQEKMNPPMIFSGTATGTLVVYIAAYNVDKGEITKAQIDFISDWLSLPEIEVLKDIVPDKELVGYYWQTWSASSGWGIGQRYDGKGEGDLRVWLRIGSDQMPEAAQSPILKPNVKIEGELPTNARVRATFDYHASDFSFTITNYESFEFPIYWRLETSSNPDTEINFYIYPIEGKQTVPGNGTTTVTAKYWFTTPGSYTWRYIAEYPKGNTIALWEVILQVSP
jgi:hypothetical protein